MNKKLFIFIITFQSSILLFSQTGTEGDPYISLGQAWFVPSNGIYHFNIGGTTFSTYVESGNGWILMASGNSSTTESSYGTSTTLTLQSDSILPSSIYTSALITDVRMNATSGPNIPFDVQSSNATVLGNLQNDRTLSVGTNKIDWTGTGTGRLKRNCASGSASLSLRIYHACGNIGNMHWQVGDNNSHEKIVLSNGTKNDLNLWIRATPVSLPIQLLNFNAIPTNLNSVILDWQTASEINNDFFTIERSKSGINWEEISVMDGAGNSSSLLSYSTIDNDPYFGISYYRLKQTDFDGQFEYSNIRSVRIENPLSSSVEIHPNSTGNQITVIGDASELKQIKIFNSLGQNITNFITITTSNEQGSIVIDIAKLNTGIYYIKTKTTAYKVYKQ